MKLQSMSWCKRFSKPMFWYIGLIVFVASVSFTSCDKHLLEKNPDDNPIVIFNHLWEDVRIKYSYFELKNIDWDEVWSRYAPRINDRTGTLQLFDILAEMLFELEDGHVNLTSFFDRSRNWEWFQDHPPNFNFNVMERNYLGKDFRITGPFRHQFLDSILYIHYPAFGSTVTENHLEVLLAFANVSKGVILDIRDNGGGSLANARRLASLFSETEQPYGMERIKNGPDINDFTEWEVIQFPGRENGNYKGQVVLLTNRKVFSAGTFFALMMSTLPQVTILGDQTGGGGGIPGFGELPNGWQYRVSVSQTVSLDDEHIELGVMPNIKMDLDLTDEINGIDTYIEAAKDLLQ